jgi:hypothetical protein
MQSILIYIIVAAALAYIGRRTYKALTHKEGAGCEHCSQSGVDANSNKKIVPGK